MSGEELSAMAARLLANLIEDVSKCTTREEHIRATARANEAQHLWIGINQMFDSSAVTEE